MPGAPQLHALLIGINNYAPESKVSSLYGTHQDIKTMRNLLETQFNDAFQALNIHELLDEKATYQAVIHAFYEKLCQAAQPGDTALFHFSGHGSFCPTPAGLEDPMDNLKQDETILCYDSRLEGNFDLADKELAALISLFKTGVDVVIIVDSCYSGSITRGFQKDDKQELSTMRFFPSGDQKRTLDGYFKNITLPELAGFYTRQAKPVIPHARHIVLMASNREQRSYENVAGGYFTQNLVDIVKKLAGQPISYIELFQRLRTKVTWAQGQLQTPQYDTFDTFSGRKHFLRPTSDVGNAQLHVKYDEQEWKLEYGAVHGMQMPLETTGVRNRLVVRLHALAGNVPPLEVFAKAVRMNTTVLDMPAEVKNKTMFKAEVVSLAKPYVQFLLEDNVGLSDAFLAALSINAPLVYLTNNPDNAKYKVLLNMETIPSKGLCYRLGVFERASNKFIHGCALLAGYPLDDCLAYLAKTLGKIEQWERLWAAANPDTIVANQVACWLEVKEANGQWTDRKEPVATVAFDGKNGVPFNLKVSSNFNDKLYYYLWWYSADFGITLFAEYTLDAATKDKVVLGTALDARTLLATAEQPPYPKASTTLLKWIASQSPLDMFLFKSDKIALETYETKFKEQERQKSGLDIPKNFETWFSGTITVNVLHTNTIK